MFEPHLVFAFSVFMLRMAYILPFNKSYSLVIGTILTAHSLHLQIFELSVLLLSVLFWSNRFMYDSLTLLWTSFHWGLEVFVYAQLSGLPRSSPLCHQAWQLAWQFWFSPNVALCTTSPLGLVCPKDISLEIFLFVQTSLCTPKPCCDVLLREKKSTLPLYLYVTH